MKLFEDVHREDLDPIDEAESYSTLKDMGTKVYEIILEIFRRVPSDHL